MEIIKNYYLNEIGDKERHFLFINTLNAKCFILSFEETQRVKKWIENGIPHQEKNSSLFTFLNENSCIVNEAKEEKEYVDRLTRNCREMHRNFCEKERRVVFVLTYECNFACDYCYEKGNVGGPAARLSKEQVDKILDLNKGKIRYIDLFGGEPLLLTNKEIIEYIIKKAPDAEYIVTTNGYYLFEYVNILEKLRINHIMVTIDGNKITHNNTRCLKNGHETYEKIRQGIDACLKRNIPIRIRMNVSKENLEMCIEERAELKERYRNSFEKSLLSFELQPLFQLDEMERREITVKVLYDCDRTSADIKTMQMNTLFFSSYPLSRKLVQKNSRFEPRYCNCDAEGNKRFYDPYGDIYSCVLALGKKKARIGSYYPDYKENKASMLVRNIETITACAECKFRFLCGGGCANEVIDEEGNALHPSCRYMEDQISEMIEYIRVQMNERIFDSNGS